MRAAPSSDGHVSVGTAQTSALANNLTNLIGNIAPAYGARSPTIGPFDQGYIADRPADSVSHTLYPNHPSSQTLQPLQQSSLSVLSPQQTQLQPQFSTRTDAYVPASQDPAFSSYAPLPAISSANPPVASRAPPVAEEEYFPFGRPGTGNSKRKR